jgi:hypothetical protein
MERFAVMRNVGVECGRVERDVDTAEDKYRAGSEVGIEGRDGLGDPDN